MGSLNLYDNTMQHNLISQLSKRWIDHINVNYKNVISNPSNIKC